MSDKFPPPIVEVPMKNTGTAIELKQQAIQERLNKNEGGSIFESDFTIWFVLALVALVFLILKRN